MLVLPLQITAVVSAHNDQSKGYNLTAVVASLNSPMDFSMYIQNFTHQVMGIARQNTVQGSVESVGELHSYKAYTSVRLTLQQLFSFVYPFASGYALYALQVGSWPPQACWHAPCHSFSSSLSTAANPS